MKAQSELNQNYHREVSTMFTVSLLFLALTSLMPFSAKAQKNACSDLFLNGEMIISHQEISSVQPFTLKQGDTLKDLEPIFKALISGKQFEIVIPENVILNLFSSEGETRLRYAEGAVDHYPYQMKNAKTSVERMEDDLLGALRDTLHKIEREQNRISTQWSGKFNKYVFSPSPTTGKSRHLFRRPEVLTELIDNVKRIGRSPWVYLRENRDLVVTNQHFLKHLKSIGQKELILYRGHHGFDYHFYRILLGTESQAPKFRRDFAEWLRKEKFNLITRGATYTRAEEIANRVEDKSVSTLDLLVELGHELTTSAMFTSPTTKYTAQWMRGRELSEKVTLKMDLENTPEWYLDQILFGGDLDAEIVFPFGTAKQIEALRQSIQIVRREAKK